VRLVGHDLSKLPAIIMPGKVAGVEQPALGQLAEVRFERTTAGQPGVSWLWQPAMRILERDRAAGVAMSRKSESLVRRWIMSSYVDEKQRRIEQFTQYLRLMRLRNQQVAKGDSFCIFDDTAPEDADSDQLKESVAVTADCLANGDSTASSGEVESGRSGGSPDESPRYIQFAFMRDCFYLDLSNNTVYPNEVEQIFQYRQGFFYARNRTDLKWVRANWDAIVKWDSLQKVYLYRDEESAAEDMAFIIYQVWKFPVDWPWYVTASAFHTGQRFDWGKRLD
jgi:hypothetical protein